MVVPDKYLEIATKFDRALRTGDFTEINTIPLDDLKLAKAHLISDRNFPYYSLLLDKINEKESMSSHKGLKVQGFESNFGENKDIFLAHIFAEEDLIGKLKKLLNKMTIDGRRGKEMI